MSVHARAVFANERDDFNPLVPDVDRRATRRANACASNAFGRYQDPIDRFVAMLLDVELRRARPVRRI
jgi:hypothetical protein